MNGIKLPLCFVCMANLNIIFYSRTSVFMLSIKIQCFIHTLKVFKNIVFLGNGLPVTSGISCRSIWVVESQPNALKKGLAADIDQNMK